VLPEMNHNELVGWHDQHDDLAVIFLRNKDDYNRTAIRTDITKDVVGKYSKNSIEIWSKGNSRVEKAFYLVHFGDWVSFELAQIRGVDPIEIKVIDHLKAALAKV
jgi:glucose/mannose-6-phosphate isomerase